MELARITKNGRADYFIIRTEKPEEWELLRPYYLQTSYDKPRAGRILEIQSARPADALQSPGKRPKRRKNHEKISH